VAEVSFDTNVLIYAIDRDDRRHPRAVELLARASAVRCVQPLQTFGEFYHAATRKGLATPAEARAYIAVWREIFEVCAADEPALDDAMDIAEQHRVAFWDALLWATVRRAGCRVLLSEDFQDGRELEGVRVIDPFLPANDTLVDLVLPPLASS
jgi:predicted nucleic acid-binding protein